MVGKTKRLTVAPEDAVDTRAKIKTSVPVELAEKLALEFNAAYNDYKDENNADFSLPGRPTGVSLPCCERASVMSTSPRWHNARIYTSVNLIQAFVGNKRNGKAKVLFRFEAEIDGKFYFIEADFARLKREYGEAAEDMIRDVTGDVGYDNFVTIVKGELEDDKSPADILSSPIPPDRDPDIKGWGDWG